MCVVKLIEIFRYKFFVVYKYQSFNIIDICIIENKKLKILKKHKKSEENN